jgi:hypothetical protein
MGRGYTLDLQFAAGLALTVTVMVCDSAVGDEALLAQVREGGREYGREGVREGGREGGSTGGREGGREYGREGGREGVRDVSNKHLRARET